MKKEFREHGQEAIIFLGLTGIQLFIWIGIADVIKKYNPPDLLVILFMIPIFITCILGLYHAFKIDTNHKNLEEG